MLLLLLFWYFLFIFLVLLLFWKKKLTWTKWTYSLYRCLLFSHLFCFVWWCLFQLRSQSCNLNLNLIQQQQQQPPSSETLAPQQQHDNENKQNALVLVHLMEILIKNGTLLEFLCVLRLCDLIWFGWIWFDLIRFDLINIRRLIYILIYISN